MKILWTVNLIPNDMAVKLGLTKEVLGGWVESMAGALKAYDDISLSIACKCDNLRFDETVNGVRYLSLSYPRKNVYASLEKQCTEIIKKTQPDIIHIEGTEFPHAKAMLFAAKAVGIPAVVSMQGILNGQYNYQCGQLQIDDMMFSGKPTEMISGWLMHLRKTRWYKPRMKAEREIIENAEYVLGRTEWDKAHVWGINPYAKYFSCNRVLREPFYHTHWDINNIERHSIYVGNAYYPLKGFHYLVMALPLLIREFPDVKVYVAGYKPYEDNDKRSFIKKGYGMYLKKLIRDLKVENHVVFTGPLSAEDVADRLSKTHVYALCSAIENSPNTLAEAMLIGTPCVASYVGGVPDMAFDKKEVLLFRNDDTSLLSWKIKELFNDDSYCISISRNAKFKAIKNHSLLFNANKLISIYNSILSEFHN